MEAGGGATEVRLLTVGMVDDERKSTAELGRVLDGGSTRNEEEERDGGLTLSDLLEGRRTGEEKESTPH